MDLFLSNNKDLVGDVKDCGRLGTSDHNMIESSVWNKGFFCPGYACIMDMSLKVNMYNGHVLEGKLCITDMYLKVNNFIPDMKVKVSHV